MQCRVSVALLCVLLAGCDDVLVTAKLDPVQDDWLVGTWVDTTDPQDTGTIQKSGDGLFGQVEDKCSGHAFSFPGDARTCYRIVRVDFDANGFTFAEIDLAKFQKASGLNLEYRIAVNVEKDGNATSCALIEATPSDLLAFLSAYPKDAYKEGSRMGRK